MKTISALIINISYFAIFLALLASADDESAGSTVEEYYDSKLSNALQNHTPTAPRGPSLVLVAAPGRDQQGLERLDHQCGAGLGSPPCGRGRCCSVNGWCGDTHEYCRGSNCRYQCWNDRRSSDERCPNCWTDRALVKSRSYRYDYYYGVGRIIRESLFDAMFRHRKDCPSQGFYSYHAFIAAAASFPGFGTTGDVVTRKRELAAFFGQTSQATTGEAGSYWEQYSWGYCHINKSSSSGSEYCTSSYWPCAPGKTYNARGPMQLTHNHNYGLAGEALGLDLINNPDLVATDPIVSFKTALWFWMTQHDNKPSCHTIVVNNNAKYKDHSDQNHAPNIGYVNIGSIIKAESSSNFGTNTVTTTTSIGYYKRYCDMLGVTYGENLKYWYDHDYDYDHDDQRTYPDVADETRISSAELIGEEKKLVR